MNRLFDKQLVKLRTRLIKMCSIVDEQVDLAVKVVEEADTGLAALIVKRDEKVDEYDIKIDKICQKILALNQPIAMDLRLIMSALTINTNLERIGDIAVNIAENFRLIGKRPEFFTRIKFSSMAVIVKDMLKNAIDSFIENDAGLAKRVIYTDDRLDKLNVENHKIIIDIMKENKDYIEDAVAMLVICRQLERIGDHATNIAEDVYFIVEAEMVKHNYEKLIMKDDDEDD